MALHQAAVVDAGRGQLRRAAAGQQHVAAGGQPVQRVLVGRIVQVQLDGALGAVEGEVGE
jgi:hypothetical protein